MNNKKRYIKIFNQIDKDLSEVIEEFFVTLNLIKEDKKLVKMRLLIAFSFLEVVCGVYNQFYGLQLTDKALLKKFIKNYCLIDRNEIYNDHPYLNKINEIYLYDLRCSITHAFVLPEHKGEEFIMIVNGDEKHEKVERMNRAFSKKGIKSIFISPYSLSSLFLKAGEIFIKEMRDKQNNPTKEDLDAINRVAKEFLRRGAKMIPF